MSTGSESRQNQLGWVYFSLPSSLSRRMGDETIKSWTGKNTPRAIQAFQPKPFDEIQHSVPLLQTCFGEDGTPLTLLGTAFQRALRVPHRAL